MMKNRLIITLIISIVALFANAKGYYKETDKVMCSFYYKGDWSKWIYYPVTATISDLDGTLTLYLRYDGKRIFTVTIPRYNSPSKKELKQHRDSREWFVYTCTVEYYVDDNTPTALDLAKKACFIKAPNPRKDVTPIVLRKATATIRIHPYKKVPEGFNIYFDKIAVGISLKSLR